MDEKQRQRKENLTRIVFLSLLVVMVFIAQSINVSASVSITSISSPSEVSEGDLISISFVAETDDPESIDYYIYINDVIVSSSSSYVWQTDYQDSGTYSLVLEANTSNSTDSVERTLIILDDLIEITITSPEEASYLESEIDIIATSIQADSCEYEVENVGSGIMTKDEDEFSSDITLSEGTYHLIITCETGNESKEESVDFSIDQSPPSITDSGPSNPYISPIIGSSATINVDTDEDATCKYATSDIDYSDMGSSFGVTGFIEHYQTIDNLASGEHHYFVRCVDGLGNEMESSQEIIFYTDARPTAEIDIQGSEPLKASRYKVTLTSSENLQSSPTLQYNFHNNAAKRTISLTGSGNVWSGYLMVEGSAAEGIGTFFFSGVDTKGIAGTEITAGKIFLVDTILPGKVDSLEVGQKGDALKLKWHFVGDDVDVFRIYRSLDSGVSYNDYYASTSSTLFQDDDVEPGVTYFYKVSVLDEAGNEGELSSQVFGSIEPELVEDTKLSATLSAKVDQKINEVESALLDIDWVIKNLENEKDKEKMSAIEKLDLIPKTKAIKSNVNSINTNLVQLKNLDLNQADFDKTIERFSSSLSTQISELVKEVNINNKFEYEQYFDQASFQTSLNDFLLYNDLTLSEELRSLNQDIGEKITITGEILNVGLDYFDEHEESFTIISKTVTSFEVLNNVEIVENIPKSVESDADDIIFSVQPKILNNDPVVSWPQNSLSSQSIYYIIDRSVDLGEAKNTKTYVFKMFSGTEIDSDADNSSDNQITGLASGNNGFDMNYNALLILFGVIVITGLLVYYFFFLKEDEEKSVEAPLIVKRPLDGAVCKDGYFSGNGFELVNKLRKLFPSRNSSDNGSLKKTSKSSPSADIGSFHLNGLLRSANVKADQLDFVSVYKLYNSILHLYSATNFDSEFEKAHVRSEISRVYSKLMLFSNLNEANKALQMNNLGLLNDYLENIKKLLEVNSKDNSYFYSYVESVYHNLSVTSIGLGDITAKNVVTKKNT